MRPPSLHQPLVTPFYALLYPPSTTPCPLVTPFHPLTPRDLGSKKHAFSHIERTEFLDSFLNASTHLYKRVYRSVRLSVRLSVRPSVRHALSKSPRKRLFLIADDIKMNGGTSRDTHTHTQLHTHTRARERTHARG